MNRTEIVVAVGIGILVIVTAVLLASQEEERESERRLMEQGREYDRRFEERAREILPTFERGGPATLSKFNQIRTGMSYADVKRILGEDGVLLSELDVGFGEGFHTVMYQWDGRGFGSMNVTFQGGRVVSKAQFGLE